LVGPLLVTLLDFTFERSKGLSEIIVFNGFKDELTEFMFPEDAFLLSLHKSADQFQGLNAVIEDAFRGILVFVLANHLPEGVGFLIKGFS